MYAYTLIATKDFQMERFNFLFVLLRQRGCRVQSVEIQS